VTPSPSVVMGMRRRKFIWLLRATVVWPLELAPKSPLRDERGITQACCCTCSTELVSRSRTYLTLPSGPHYRLMPLPARKTGGALETPQSSWEKTLVVAYYVRQLVAHAVTLQALGKCGLATLGGTVSLQAFSNSLTSHVTACE
jgi:hypothetical protein